MKVQNDCRRYAVKCVLTLKIINAEFIWNNILIKQLLIQYRITK